MIVVTIELWPLGNQTRRRHLGTAKIANVGGTATAGNYKVTLSKWGRPSQTWKTGHLNGFLRQRFGPWDLLALVLIATLGDRLTAALASQPEQSRQAAFEEGDTDDL